MKRGKEVLVVLHALVICRGPVPRALLHEWLRTEAGDEKHHRDLTAYISSLRRRHRIPIEPGNDPVTLNAAAVRVDLWDFLDAAQDPSRLEEARGLLAKGPLQLPYGDRSAFEEWNSTIEEFEEAKRRVLADPPPPEGPAATYVRDTCKRLLDRPVVPGVIDEQKVRDVLDIAKRLKALRTEDGEGSRAADLADRLEGKVEDRGSRIALVGGSGAGKEITATLTYLELARRFERDPEPHLVPIFVDVMRSGYERGFGSREWLARREEEAGFEEGQKPLIVLTHADAFLAAPERKVQASVAFDLFQVEHLLICCGANFYRYRLRSRRRQLEADEEWLESWSREHQEDFVEVAAGAEALEEFRRWLGEDKTRSELCSVPLHLVYVLSLLGQSERLETVSRPAQLLDAVAQLRLENSLEEDFDVEDCTDLLGAVAHHFYEDSDVAPGPIQLSRSQLRTLLRHKKDKLEDPWRRADEEERELPGPRQWADELEERTLLGSDDRHTLSFEHPVWGPFFVARHVDSTLRDRPQETLRAFSKFLTAEVASLCEELLEASARTDAESLRRALRTALDHEDTELDDYRTRIAREQICYFLGTIRNPGMRSELFRRVEPDSDSYEPDPLIRRAILFGLADGGLYRAANRYVTRLRAEREEGGTRERDTNVGFHLTFRGDQPFDPERPEAISTNAPCTRTVAALVRGLQQREHRGSRRIKLFTLLELAAHPRIDLKTFDAEFEKNLDDLAAVHEHLGKGQRSKAWPELEELGRLIAEFREGKR